MTERESAIPMAAFTRAELDAFARLEAEALDILEKRRAAFEAPSVRFEPTGDDILVYRLPPKERRSKGGIVLPTFTMDKVPDRANPYSFNPEEKTEAHDVVLDVGLLLGAGLSARDWMRSHGVFVGDFVRFGRFAGREHDAQWFDVIHEVEGDPKNLLSLRIQDIQGSFDLHWRLHGNKYEDKDGKKHETRPVLRRMFVHDGHGNGLTVIKPIAKE